MNDLWFSFRIGVSTLGVIIHDVCGAIWTCMKPQWMSPPDKEKWLEISTGFWKNSNFPNCIGAVDGKHIRVMKPLHSGTMYYNFKNYFSIQLLAICDANYCFKFVYIGDYGKNNDSFIFQNSEFQKRYRRGLLDLPYPDFLPENDMRVPFVLVGDEAFAMSNVVMRPYGGHSLPIKKRVFKYRLTRARRFIECSFGILSNKWRILHRPLNVGMDLAIDIVKACVLLHNFVRTRDGYSYTDTLHVEGVMENEMPPVSVNAGNNVAGIRDYLADYFLTEGELPWQYSKI